MSQPQTAQNFATSGTLSAFETAAFSPVNGYHQLKPVAMETIPAAEVDQRLPSIGSLFTSGSSGTTQATVSVSSKSFLELLTTESSGTEPQLQAQLATFDSYLDALRQGMEASQTPVSSATDQPSQPSPQAGCGAPEAKVSLAAPSSSDVTESMSTNPLLPFNSWEEVLVCAFRQSTGQMSVDELCAFVKRLFPCFSRDNAERHITECLQSYKLFSKVGVR